MPLSAEDVLRETCQAILPSWERGREPFPKGEHGARAHYTPRLSVMPPSDKWSVVTTMLLCGV